MNFTTRGQISRARRLVNEVMRHFPGAKRSPVEPSVAIVTSVMDRSDDLPRTLPSILNQDYSQYSVCELITVLGMAWTPGRRWALRWAVREGRFSKSAASRTTRALRAEFDAWRTRGLSR